MPKIHTRVKRSRNLSFLHPKRGVKGEGITRPKSFRSEKKAEEWAKAHALKNYLLDNIGAGKNKKIKIRIKR